MPDTEREDLFRQRVRLARPYLISALVLFGIGVSIRQWLPSNGVSFTLSSIFVVAALISGMLSASAMSPKHEPPPSLAVRINELSENLTRSGTLIAEISAEMQLQTAAFERISAEAEQNRHLASLHQDEADAVRRVIETTHKKVAKIADRRQWFFFLSGIPVGVIVNWIYDYLTH